MAGERGARIEDLLAHSEWLRRLARHLAGGEDAAEDALQDMWVAAHRSPPDSERSARPWLGVVLRNAVRLRFRSDTRRQQREASFTSRTPNAGTAVDEAYERAELQRFLVEAVMALEESLRVVVILRYFEGFTSDRIGELVGAPPATVRSRLRAALEKLRAKLDLRSGGDRRVWVGALTGAALDKPIVAPVALGAVAASNTKMPAGILIVVTGILLLLGTIGFWLQRRGGSATPDNQLASPSTAPHQRSHAADRSTPVRLVPPQTSDQSVTAATGTENQAAAAASVAGTVESPDGRAVPAATVELVIRPALAGSATVRRTETSAMGTFSIGGLPAGRLEVTSSHPQAGVARYGPEALASGQRLQITLQLAAPGSVAGEVRDEDNRVLAGVEVLARSLNGPSRPVSTRTDADGRYLLAPLGSGETRLSLRRDDEILRLVGGTTESDVRFALKQGERRTGVKIVTARRSAMISGVVLAANGRPMAGTAVHALARRTDPYSPRVSRSAVTDPEGRFTVEALYEGTYTLRVAAGDHAETVLDNVLAGKRDVIVRLDPGARVSGRVVRETRDPVAAYVLRLVRRAPENSSEVEVNAGRSPPLALKVQDPHGEFALEKVGAGRYQLLVATDDDLFGDVALVVASGESLKDIQVTVGTGVTLRGTVVDFHTRSVVPGATLSVNAFGITREANTNADGRFSLPRVPGGVLHMRVRDQDTHLTEVFTLSISSSRRAVDLHELCLVPGDSRVEVVPRLDKIGVGITFGMTDDGHLIVARIRANSTTAREDIRVGDDVLAIDGRSVAGVGPAGMNSLIKGAPESPVRLTVRTPKAGAPPRTVTLKHQHDPSRRD